jgi:signal peptidase I
LSFRILNLAFVTLVLVAWCVFLRPTFLGGPVGYVIVSGHSMEPLFHTGDFVVTRRSDYQKGDVIAFHTGESSGIVIHRIIGGNSQQGFLTQGDNRQTPDQWHPRSSQVIGKSWIHIAGLGKWLGYAREPVIFASVIGLLGFLVVVTGRTRSRNHSRGDDAMATNESNRTRFSLSPIWVMAGVAVVLAAASILGAAYAFTHSTQTTRIVHEPRYSQSTSFDYSIMTQPSTLYPDGRIGPVNDSAAASDLPPVYSRLVQTLDVGFHYQLDGATARDVNGTYDARVVVTAGEDDWSRPQEMIPSTPFDGSSFDGRAQVDLATIRNLIDSIEQETGVAANFYTIAVILDVNVAGGIADETLSDGQQPTLTFRLNRSRITPPTDLVVSSTEDRTALVTAPHEIGMAGLSVPVGRARVASAGGIALSLVLVAAVCAAFLTGFGQSEASILRTRYGAIVIPVTQVEERGSRTVRIESLTDLGRLAQRSGGVIYSQQRQRTTRYLITDGVTVVEYVQGGGLAPVPDSDPDPIPFDGQTSNRPAAS